MAFNPTDFGATPVATPASGGFNAANFGATPIQTAQTPTPQAPQSQQSFTDSIWQRLASSASDLLGPASPNAIGQFAKVGNMFGGKQIGEGLGTAYHDASQMAQLKNPFANPTEMGGVQQPGINPASQVNKSEMIGGTANAIATIFPGLPLAGKALDVAKSAAPLAKSVLLGKEGINTLSQIANSAAKEFVPVTQGGAGKTFQTVVDATQKAIDSFVGESKATLQAVKDAIPNVQVDKGQVAKTVDNGIMKSIQNNAEYRGVQNANLFKTPEELIHSGLMTPEEVAKTNGIVNAVKGWSDYSARGILNLKEQLGAFYKDGLNNSNAVLRNVQNGLKDIVGNVAPEVKPALEAASKNIDKADEFARHLLGANETTGESKLIQIAKNLANPALKGYQHTLLDELKAATGHDVLPKLKGYADYLDLLAKDFPSKAGTILKTAGKRLGITGGIGAGIMEGKKLLGF